MDNFPTQTIISVDKQKAPLWGAPSDVVVPISRILSADTCASAGQPFILEVSYHTPRATLILTLLPASTVLHQSKDLAVAPAPLPERLIPAADLRPQHGCHLLSLVASLFAPRALPRTGVTRYCPALRLASQGWCSDFPQCHTLARVSQRLSGTAQQIYYILTLLTRPTTVVDLYLASKQIETTTLF